MKRIVPPSLKDLFQYTEGISDLTKFHEEVKVYNSFTFFFLTTLFFLFLGFFHRPSLIMGLSFLCYLLYEYLKLQKISKQLDIKRESPRKAREKENLKFKYEILNGSAFKLKSYTLIDKFEGDHNGVLKLESPLPLNHHTKISINHLFRTDAGMGVHKASELTLVLKDSLELFNFKIEETKEREIEVFPSLENIPTFETPFDPLSFHHGEMDIPHRGDSINFHSIRAYRPGDPIKHINWRQTAKQGQTIINVFEKNINKSLTLLLNCDERLHSGKGSFSTLEYMKDFALALASQHINNGNEVQIITNNKVTPRGAGQSFINRLEHFLFKLELCRDMQANFFIRDKVKENSKWSDQNVSFIYLTPIVPGNLFEKNMEEVFKLNQKGHLFNVLWIDAFPYLDKQLKYGSSRSVKHQLAMVGNRKDFWKQRANQSQTPCYDLVIDSKTHFSQAIMKSKEKLWRN